MIARRYCDEEEWTLLSEAEAVARLEPFYQQATPQVMKDLADGETIWTDVAEYRKGGD